MKWQVMIKFMISIYLKEKFFRRLKRSNFKFIHCSKVHHLKKDFESKSIRMSFNIWYSCFFIPETSSPSLNNSIARKTPLQLEFLTKLV